MAQMKMRAKIPLGDRWIRFMRKVLMNFNILR